MKAENLENKEKQAFIEKLGGSKGILLALLKFSEEAEDYEMCAQLKVELDKIEAGKEPDFSVSEIVKVTLSEEEADELFDNDGETN